MPNKPILVALFSFLIIASIFAVNLVDHSFSNALKVQVTTKPKKNTKLLLAPSASISGTTGVCINSSPDPQITFTGSGGTAPYTFTYELNGTLQPTISTLVGSDSVNLPVSTTTSGTFGYRLIGVRDANGEEETFSETAIISVYDLPVVDFNFNNDNTCSGIPVNFTSNVTGDGPFTYSWNFGDGTFSTDNNPTHVFEALGCGVSTFNVSLTVTDSNGCTSSFSQPVKVIDKPDINFKDAKFDNPVQFFNNCSSTSTDETFEVTVQNISASSCVSSYTIDWGDGNSEPFETTTISHTYTYSDTFRMEITGVGDNGCESTKTYIVKNATNPKGNIVSPGSTQNICAPAEIAFTISSNWGANSIDTDYIVDYGDGTIVTFHQEEMQVTGGYYNPTDPVNSLPYPIPHTYKSSNCPNDFQASISIVNSCATTPGLSGGIRILKNADPNFEPEGDRCVNLPIEFNNTSDTGSAFDCSDFIEFTWDFGDGSPEVKTFDYSSVNHIYTAPGNYTVKLSAKNGICDETSFQDTVCVEPELVANFTLNENNGCTPFNLNATNTTDLSDSCGGVTYLWEVDYIPEFCGTTMGDWEFTDGKNENSPSPSFKFISAGTYTLTLTATNSCGSDSRSETVEVKRPPKVSINAIEDFCGSASINPVANVDTCAPDTEIVTYEWDFEGGTPSSASTLDPGTITYNSPGNYQITLKVKSSCGETTATEDFEINEVPSITNMDLAQTICSGGETEKIELTSNLTNTTFSWTTSAPSNIDGELNPGSGNEIPIHTLTLLSGDQAEVIYSVTPLLGDCPGATENFVITINKAPSIISHPQGKDYCQGANANPLTFTLDDNTIDGIMYQWYYNEDGNRDPDNSTKIDAPEGTLKDYPPPTDILESRYYFAVITFTGSGSCKEIITQTALININQNISITDHEPLTQKICQGAVPKNLTIETNNDGTGSTTYQWYKSDDANVDASDVPVGTNSTIYNSGILDNPNTYYFYVVIDADESIGCTNVTSDIFTIQVVEDPTVAITPDYQEICEEAVLEPLQALISGGVDEDMNGTIDSNDYNFQWYVNGTIITGATASSFQPNGDEVGTFEYFVEISQDNELNCSAESNVVTVKVNPGPKIIVQPQGKDYCQGAEADLLTFTINDDTIDGVMYQWYYNGDGNRNPDNSTKIDAPKGTQKDYRPPTNILEPRYYFAEITFTGPGSCKKIITQTALVNINENISITEHLHLTQEICQGAELKDLIIETNNNGTGTTTYQWYSSDDANVDASDTPVGEDSKIFNPGILDETGTHYFYVVISADKSVGCANETSDMFTIEVTEAPVVIITPEYQEICAGTPLEALQATVSGGIDMDMNGTVDNNDYNFQWYVDDKIIGGANSSTFNPENDEAGEFEYFVEISQDNELNCSAKSNVVLVKVNKGPKIEKHPLSQAICTGEPLQMLEITLDSDVGNPTIKWFSNDTPDMTTPTEVGTGAILEIADSTTPGTTFYYAVVTFSEGGCSTQNSEIAEITINQTPYISDKEIVICSGNFFEIKPENSGKDVVPLGTTYHWEAPVISPDGSVQGASEELIEQESISQNLSNDTKSVATVTYTVTPSSGTCVGPEFIVEVTVNPSISIETFVKTDSKCFSANGGSIEIEIVGGLPYPDGNPYTINWTGPDEYRSSNKDIFNLAPGEYTVTISDAGDCDYMQRFTIEEPDKLIFSAIHFDPESISCFGANDGAISIEVSGGTTPYTYTWTRNGMDFSTDEDINNLGPGQYEITVIDANNCEPITQNFDVVEPPELLASLNNKVDVICYGEATGEINIDIFGGRPSETSPGILDYNYSWTGPNGFTSTNQNLTGLIAGRYSLTVMDRSNCLATLDVVIDQSDEILITTTATEIVCDGDNDGSITINSITGGNPPYDVAWSNLGSGLSQTNLSPGTYVITITDATNCVKEATVVIAEPPIFRITPEVQNVSCFGADDARIILNLEGGIDPVNLNWDDDPSAGVERNNIGPGTYTVTITDGKPCVIKETFTITEPAPLDISGTKIDALDCDDANTGSINAIVTGGTLPLTYQWSNGATTEDLSNIPPGDYTLNVTDANNCTISKNFTINRFEPLEIEVDIITDFDCSAKTVDQSFVANPRGGVPPYQINWSSGNISGANNEVMQTDINGLVIIDVTDSLGCTASLSYNVDIPELGDPNFDISAFAFTNFGFYSIEDPIQFTNLATGDFVGVSWDFGDGSISNDENPTHIYQNEGTYNVTQNVVYPFECVYTRIITLVIQKGYNLIVPNAFTPNSDNLNERFAPAQMALSNMRFEIYDTWGSMIYSEEGNSLRGWDGKIKDSEAENGNYYYTFSGETFYGRTITSKGVVTLIK